ncbi:hypothetical protein PHYBLDRAFT_72130 [Phycomyces blakesleeanus NRRL 1555(-)]|uniref:Uncharacterized protein n=1 Tax=Phycomyces blakesleeanus (strain ATCC 8743b / DSM 1359 / FGSC 10004 / NBRC 33097 / NRRL 1555) TaxID=763407 RepID=A0A163CZZ3_PHYB8|nr:hypothetical protein PHYBLDRAFT_72130 [Phycomyces blakesleeanus NRRL 1555(-)]OAD67720.1 hypothetical protein PHYBLDRAFT_72130 [Phycomyces blakesleeanus NRRL 1555(-)]|eukprot:XP_018285760.1 hypothetical protein PHYBLDRAFT_72130 [Phycomyces blakesleeanus NRRL 1555(-)]
MVMKNELEDLIREAVWSWATCSWRVRHTFSYVFNAKFSSQRGTYGIREAEIVGKVAKKKWQLQSCHQAQCFGDVLSGLAFCNCLLEVFCGDLSILSPMFACTQGKNFHSLQLDLLQLSFNNGQLEVLGGLLSELVD